MSLLRANLADSIGTIAFDHYARRNALSAAMIDEILAALDRFKTDRARAVIFRSAAPGQVWSAGHAVDELPTAGEDPLPYNDPLERLLRAVKGFPAPVIAMVQGGAWGGACDLVMSCDIVLGDETCAFAITPAKLGLPYNVAGFLDFMSRIPLTIVKEMFFTADPLPAARALRVGIVNEIVPAAELEARTFTIARTIASRSPAAIAAFKETIHALSEATPIAPATYEYLEGLRRNVYFGRDYREGIQAFLEKRRPIF